MKKIPLTQGKFAIVDDKDFEYLSQWKWYASKEYNTFYAKRKDKGKTISMHQTIVKASKGLVVDHIDGNGLNNAQSNLRGVTHKKNIANRMRINRNNKSGIKNVHYIVSGERNKRWIAKVKRDYKNIGLGYFFTKEEASNAVQLYFEQNPV